MDSLQQPVQVTPPQIPVPPPKKSFLGVILGVIIFVIIGMIAGLFFLVKPSLNTFLSEKTEEPTFDETGWWKYTSPGGALSLNYPKEWSPQGWARFSSRSGSDKPGDAVVDITVSFETLDDLQYFPESFEKGEKIDGLDSYATTTKENYSGMYSERTFIIVPIGKDSLGKEVGAYIVVETGYGENGKNMKALETGKNILSTITFDSTKAENESLRLRFAQEDANAQAYLANMQQAPTPFFESHNNKEEFTGFCKSPEALQYIDPLMKIVGKENIVCRDDRQNFAVTVHYKGGEYECLWFSTDYSKEFYFLGKATSLNQGTTCNRAY